MKNNRLIFFLIFYFFLLFSCNKSEWQKKHEKDRKLHLIENEIDSLAEIALNLLRHGDVENAELKIEKIEKSCDSLNYKIGLAKVEKLHGLAEMLNGNNSKAIKFFKKAAYRFFRHNDFEELAFCITYVSSTYNHKGVFDSAIIYLDSAFEIHKAHGLENDDIPKSTLCIIYYDQGFYEKTVPIYKNLSKNYFEKNDTLNYNKILLNLASSYAALNEFDSAQFFLNKCLFAKNQSNSSLKADQIFSLANVYFNKKEFDTAEVYFKRAIKIYKLNDDNIGLDNCMNILGDLYSEIGKSDKAIGAFRKAIGYFGKTEEPAFLIGYYDNISDEFAKIEKYDSAYYYKKLSSDLRNGVFTEESNRSVAEFKAKYNNEKLQNEALLLEKERDKEKNKNKRQLVVTFSLSALLIISVLLVQLFRQRYISNKLLAAKNEELHKQKLDEMQKEIKLQRMSALMEGQEQERTRVATELHDGLGSLLSTVKHHFEAVESKMETNIEMYGKAQNLLDEACREVRRISHDMASNVLSRFGLAVAMQDLAEMVSSSGTIKVQVIISGMEGRLESSQEINLFRIAQELMGNIIKHAKANKVSIQLTQHDDSINLIVEDNGIGFDFSEGKEKGGMGLRNLNARVEHMHGSIDFDSGKGSGTTVIVEVPINENYA